MLAIAGLMEERNDSVTKVVSLCVQCLAITLCLVLKTVMMQHIFLCSFSFQPCVATTLNRLLELPRRRQLIMIKAHYTGGRGAAVATLNFILLHESFMYGMLGSVSFTVNPFAIRLMLTCSSRVTYFPVESITIIYQSCMVGRFD